MTESLTIPTVHINGTSKQELLDQLATAIMAIHDAGKKLARACPHGRDYYVQDGEAIHKAMREHEARMEKLRSVSNDLTKIAEAVFDQKDWNER